MDTLYLFAFICLVSSVYGESPVPDERAILLQFKESISDPHEILKSWGAKNGSSHCSWFGVSCDSKSRVSALNIRGINGGKISSAVGELKHLRVLSLPSNDLHGEIPFEIFSIENLLVLDLEGNRISGNFSAFDFSRLRKLRVLNLGSSRIFGEFPRTLLECRDLQIINVAHNEIYGNIPRFLGSFRSLRYLSSSSNPKEPTSPPDSKASTKDEILSVAVIFGGISALIAVMIFLVCSVACFCCPKREKRATVGPANVSPVPARSPTAAIITFQDVGVAMTYESILRATDNFDQSYCIGSGGFGSTYRARLSPEVTVAVKRCERDRSGTAQLQAEVRTLGRLTHPNLITLIGYHHRSSHGSEMFLIYNYMPGGNLSRFIRKRATGKQPFEWRVLHKIALQVASALSFLHEGCSPYVLHRDIKPSNILLDGDENAFVSDFGLSKFLEASTIHVTTCVAGTNGYIDPEYSLTGRVTKKSDVYSYGVVVLELLSCKRVLDPWFASFGEGFDLVCWASLLMSQGRVEDFFLESLWDRGPRNKLMKMLHLGIMCTMGSTEARPKMSQVVHRLNQIERMGQQ